ncbi:hypothetical protein [Kitasatospora sp. MBT63]|uniref:hypothetical protein n=1 Tax=Kitasatospora sp. MBT63 TaxID=1444768 RepID=UPI00068BE410|nr:hypothetical protein [Kitasatospora sp. MBT63]
MSGVQIAVEYVFAWLVRQAGSADGRAEEPADTEQDPELAAGKRRLCEAVARRLGSDPALERAREEASAPDPQLSERTRRRLADSLADATERDPRFAEELRRRAARLPVSDRLRRLDQADAVAGAVYNTISGGSHLGHVVQAGVIAVPSFGAAPRDPRPGGIPNPSPAPEDRTPAEGR